MKRQRRNNKGIATWLKWLLGIMAVGFVLCLATCGTGAYFIFQEAKKAVDPEHCKEVASKIVTMKELPANYKYGFGTDFMGVMTMVAVQNETTNTTFMLIKVPNSDKVTSADELVEQIAERGVATPSADGGSSQTRIEVQEKGKTTVAGVEMPYIMGLSSNKSTGKQLPSFMGCVMPNSDSALIVYASSDDEKKPLNLAEVNSFLANITEFKK